MKYAIKEFEEPIFPIGVKKDADFAALQSEATKGAEFFEDLCY